MAVCYTTWKVLPHEPIDKLAPNLWRVRGKMEGGTVRQMQLARLADGRVLVHNAIALDEPEMAEIDAWGEVAAVLVPNGFHRQDSRIFRERYPKAKVYCPAKAVKAVNKATPVDGTYADVPQDATVCVRHLEGIKEREGFLEVRHDQGVTQIFCDTILNMPPTKGIIGFFLHPTGQVSVPRFARWFFASDKAALKADLLRIGEADGLVRILPGHGADITEGIREKMREAAKVLE